MNVAVLTLTRDRLPYTQHCFATLQENAGCAYDHYVLDQASTDGTVEWLEEQDDLDVTFASENLGCCRGWNYLLDNVVDVADYDVVVCFDNDCEVIQPGTLEQVAWHADEYYVILAPRVLGLNNPPPTIGTFNVGALTVDETTILGNIFMAIPARLLTEFRWDERHPLWDGGETITNWFRTRGGRCGYVQGYAVNHYLTTSGQHADIPEYFARTLAEGKPRL
jgi:glycosyltransferase involved in cell wall biosynthesis